MREEIRSSRHLRRSAMPVVATRCQAQVREVTSLVPKGRRGTLVSGLWAQVPARAAQRRGTAARAKAQARADGNTGKQGVHQAAAAAAAAVVVASAGVTEDAGAKDVDSYAGLTPCKQSKQFDKREKKQMKDFDRRLKKYEEGSAPALALQESKANAQKRFEAYREAGLLCGSDGLPHLIVDGNRQHLGEFVVPGIFFLYFAGWIGWAGRDYLIQNKAAQKKPAEGEIVINVPRALGSIGRALAWPVLAISEFRNGKFLRNDNQVTISPR